MPLEDTEIESVGSLRDELASAFDAKAKGEPIPEPAAEKPASEKAAAKPDKQPDKAPPAKVDDVAPKSIDPPARWTAAEKEEFAALDPKVQKLLLGRNKGLESDYTKKMQDIGVERQRYRGLDEILAPRRDEFVKAGLDDAGALKVVFSYWDAAQRDPIGFIKQFAESRRIDLAAQFGQKIDVSQLAPAAQPSYGPDGQPLPPSLHPVVVQLLEQQANEIAALRQDIGHTSQVATEGARDRHAQIVQSAASEYHSFQGAVDEHGSPRYPFFEDVRIDMGRLMQSTPGLSLSDAYDRAVYAHPETREKLLTSQRIAWKRSEEARLSGEAAKARKAGASITPSSTGVDHMASAPPAGSAPMSVRGELETAFASIRSRGRV